MDVLLTRLCHSCYLFVLSKHASVEEPLNSTHVTLSPSCFQVDSNDKEFEFVPGC